SAHTAARDTQARLPGFADVLEFADQQVESLAVSGRLRDLQTRAGAGPEQPDLHGLVRCTPFLVVLGDPGAGKSTLVRMIMLALAEGRGCAAFDFWDEWLPIFFPVAAFAEVRSDPGSRDI